MGYDHPQHIKGRFKWWVGGSYLLGLPQVIINHLAIHLRIVIFHHKPSSSWCSPTDLTSIWARPQSPTARPTARPSETSDPRCPGQSLQCRPQVTQILGPGDAKISTTKCCLDSDAAEKKIRQCGLGSYWSMFMHGIYIYILYIYIIIYIYIYICIMLYKYTITYIYMFYKYTNYI